ERLKREQRLPVDEVVRIGVQIASALAHLHARGIVHRDVKPANILLTAGGDAKLCDMGLARPMANGMTVTETAMVVGTPAYMAPEQATGQNLTAAADVYALGLTLYQALTGQVPLEDATALSTLMRRQKERPPSVRREAHDVPHWLARLLDRMLDPRLTERPTAEQVQRALSGGRFRFRPRRRTVIAAASLAAMLAAVPAIYSQLDHQRTVQFQVRGSHVIGLDAQGRQTWSRPIGAAPAATVRADLDGDGTDELAVATNDVDSARTAQHQLAGVRIFYLHGHVLLSVRLRDIIRQWSFPYPLLLQTELQAADLDEDGRAELIVLCRQMHFYPSEILVYWPARDRWQVVLEHPGYLRNVAVLPDPRRPRLRFAGLVNRPIYAPVAGEIVLKPSEPQKTSLGSTVRLQPGRRSAPGAFLAWYTLLDPDRAEFLGDTTRIRAEDDGGSTITGSMGTVLTLDRWGNPVPGPNHGVDLREARCRFIERLTHLRYYSDSANPTSIETVTRQLRARFRPLLAETPYRTALDVVEARVLAGAGAAGRAITLLQGTVRDTHNDDAVLLLGNLLGVTGRVDRAIALLEPAVGTPRTQRANFDGRLLLFHLAVERKDRALVERSLFRFGSAAQQIAWGESTVAAILARAHLWWDEVGETDCQVRSWPYEPAGNALACLARWRLGRTAADDPKLMRRGVQDNPDAIPDFRVAEAAAQLGLGHPDAAVVLLDKLLPWLRTAATNDFANHQILDLARALHATALLATGDRAAARTEAHSLLPTLTPGLLPAHLVREVLDATPAETATSHR
ncbi:MAG TPA: serine/threonine protein kinase, partial [Acidobacteria bacterium]|nr:serine/threonine protein kinase [Acidobacteriota bacterium]